VSIAGIGVDGVGYCAAQRLCNKGDSVTGIVWRLDHVENFAQKGLRLWRARSADKVSYRIAVFVLCIDAAQTACLELAGPHFT
jgi:ketopantoate reductase